MAEKVAPRKKKNKPASITLDMDGLPHLIAKTERRNPKEIACRCAICSAPTAYWRSVKFGILVKCGLCNSTVYLNSPLAVELWKAKARSILINREIEEIYFKKALLPILAVSDDVKIALDTALFPPDPV